MFNFGVIEQLIAKHGVGMVATHDLEIAKLETAYPDYVRNFYFDIQVKDGEMLFDYKISKRLEPNLMTDLIGASEALGLLASFTLGYYPTLFKFAGEKTARKLSQQMLLNPRFQQISTKMVDAIKDNKANVAKKLSDLLATEVRKTSPEAALKLEELSEEELMKFFKDHRQGKEEKEE